MSQYLSAFLLGNAAILGNVCVLPLYPGLIAFLAGNAQAGRQRRGGMFLGAAVLAGVLLTMILLGLALYLLGQTFSQILTWLLPLTYGAVALLGLAMLLGHNPFARLASTRAPILSNSYATAILYGCLLAPMTLPCTGPVVVSAFVLGAGSATALGESLLYFLAFGLGFGWPLLVLPLLAVPLQRGSARWLATHATTLGRLAGLLLIVIAAYGFWIDILPNV